MRRGPMRLALPGIAVLAIAASPQPAPGPTETPRGLVVERVVGPAPENRSIFERIAGTPARDIFERPYGVAWEGESLLVADPAAGRVVRIDPKGKVSASRDGLLDGPICVAACPWGIVVADSRSGAVSLLERDLRSARTLLTGLERPTGVACDGAQVYVAETGAHRIVVVGPGGEVAARLGGRGETAGMLNFPAAVALAGPALWVGDTLNFRLQRLDRATGAATGGFGALGDAPGETPRVKGIAVDPLGRLWVTDAHLDRVALFREDGQFLASFGGPGTAPGEFSFPAGIASKGDGRMAVVDSLNRRVQVLRLADAGNGAQR